MEKDTIPGKKTLGKIVFNFDARYSFVDKETVKINGLKLGIHLKERVRTGLAFYFLSSNFTEDIPPNTGLGNQVANLRFRYAALFSDYIMYTSRRWEVSPQLQAGFGSLYYRYSNNAGELVNTDKQPIYIVEPSLNAHYKFFYWIGIGAGVGYRQVLNSDSKLPYDMDAPIFNAKVKLFLGEIYKEYIRRKQTN